MNKNTFLDLTGYWLARFFVFVFSCMPLRLAIWLGKRIGGMAYYLSGSKRRGIAYANIKSALGEQLSLSQRRRLLKKVYCNFGMMIVEIFRFPKIDKDYIGEYVEFDGFDLIERSFAKGKGVVFLTAHFGNWELCSIAAAIKGYPVTVIAREQRYSRLDEFLNQYRELKGCRVIRKGMALREVLKVLKSGGMMGLLSDQDVGKGGCFVNLFGRPTSTAHGIAAFALKTGCEILFALMVRKKNAEHKIFVREIEVERTGDNKKDEERIIQRYSEMFESFIKKYPDQWLWMHKRWKSCPVKRVLILSDGKPGHLNQSLAVAETVKQRWLNANEKYRERFPDYYQKLSTNIEVAEVRYRNGRERPEAGCGDAKLLNAPQPASGRSLLPKEESRFRKCGVGRLFTTLCAFFGGRRCQGCMRCLKFSLTDASYKELMSKSADVIISCGASAAPVNVVLTQENFCRNIVIMKPRMVRRKKFDLIIMPRHDVRGKVEKNVVVTAAAPAKRMERVENRGERRNIGILIGGDTKGYQLPMVDVERMLNGVWEFCEKKNAGVLLTTSRRSSDEIEKMVRNFKVEVCGARLAVSAKKSNRTPNPEPRTPKLRPNGVNLKLCVIANEENPKGAVAKILSESDLIIVSPESVSMISEAVNSGKPVVVFDGGISKLRRKQRLMLKNLAEEGYLHIVRTGEMSKGIEEIFNRGVYPKALDDYKRIYEAVGRVV